MVGKRLHLRHDFVPEVPREDHHVRGTAPFRPAVDVLHGNVRARRVSPVLVAAGLDS